jgi:hypothetical protein
MHRTRIIVLGSLGDRMSVLGYFSGWVAVAQTLEYTILTILTNLLHKQTNQTLHLEIKNKLKSKDSKDHVIQTFWCNLHIS